MLCNHSGIRYDIYLSQGTSFSLDLQATDCFGTPYNLNGYSGVARIVSSYCATGTLATFNVSFTNPNSGLMNISLSALETATLPVTFGFYDLIVSSGIYATKYLYGKANIFPTVY